jgi:hypothetical protein
MSMSRIYILFTLFPSLSICFGLLESYRILLGINQDYFDSECCTMIYNFGYLINNPLFIF